ncbi:MAG: glycosyltransferase, partial [Bryobacterales bacterium]|nr:glycosyltransferase [Bryobacterales bacterium]
AFQLLIGPKTHILMAPTRCKTSAALVLDMTPTVWQGLDEFHFQLCAALMARGVQPVVIFAHEPPPAYIARFETTGAVVSALDYSAGYYQYFRGLGKIFRQYNVKVMQSRGFSYLTLLWWMAYLNGVRRIIYVAANSGVLRARSWKKFLLRLTTRMIMLPITKVVSVTGFIKQQIVDLSIPAGRVLPIYNGVDLIRFSPDATAREVWRKEYGIQPNELVIASISYLRPYKYVHTLLEAFSILLRGGSRAHLFIAGDGPLFDELQKLSQDLGITGRVHWLGNFSMPEKLLQGSDIFVLASVGEAFGFAVAEAMACGVPAVASRSGGFPEIVEEGKTGFLAKPADAADFADRMQQLAADPNLRREMSQRSIERARQCFSAQNTVGNFLKLYEALGVFERA